MASLKVKLVPFLDIQCPQITHIISQDSRFCNVAYKVILAQAPQASSNPHILKLSEQIPVYFIYSIHDFITRNHAPKPLFQD